MNQPNELYGSHLPILTRVMDLTHGPVLEIGMGLYSTPLLHTMCELQQRPLISYDNDPKWFKENEKWTSKFHEVHFVEDWDDIEHPYKNIEHYGVVLIDEKPASHRIKSVKFMANHANYILIHDSEPESNKYFRYSWIYKLFKYRYDYTKLTPNTTVLSNFCDLSNLA